MFMFRYVHNICIAGGFRMTKRGGLDVAEDRDKICYSFHSPTPAPVQGPELNRCQ